MSGARAAGAGAGLLVSGLLVALWPLAAAAKPGTPGPAYFEGLYERIGRGAAPGYAPINDLVRLVPDGRGQGMILRSCGQADLFLSFGPAFEVENLMTGAAAGAGWSCLFDDNGYGAPVLTCRAEDGHALTLWPDAPAAGLPCE